MFKENFLLKQLTKLQFNLFKLWNVSTKKEFIMETFLENMWLSEMATMQIDFIW